MIRDDRDGWMRFRRTREKYIRSPQYQRFYEMSFPTVYDCDEFEADETQRTIRQIINGQCAYSGTQIEPTPDPFDKGTYARRLEDERIIARLRETWERLKAE